MLDGIVITIDHEMVRASEPVEQIMNGCGP